MKAQAQIVAYGDGGEQLDVYSGQTADASTNFNLVAALTKWLTDFYGGKWVQLGQDVGSWVDATIGYTAGLTVDPAIVAFPTIEQKADQLTEHGWYQLGEPQIDEKQAPDGIGRYRHYQNGSLYWSPGRGAHLVHGRI